jgi:glucose dehydrogenase
MFEYNHRKSHTGLNRREVIRLSAAAAALPLLGDVAALGRLTAAASTPVEWRYYAGDNSSTKYSTLDQITAENFNSLKVAWTWRSVGKMRDRKL